MVQISPNINYVNMEGVLSALPTFAYVFGGEGHYSSCIDVERASGRIDTITVVIPERLLVVDNIPLETEQLLRINGCLLQTTKYGLKDVSVLVDTIERIDSVTDCARNNIVIFGGEIAKWYPIRQVLDGNKELKVVILESANESSPKVGLKVVAWNNAARYIEETRGIGDRLIVKCRLESRQRFLRDDVDQQEESEDRGSVKVHEASLVSILPDNGYNGVTEV